jgi:hypothetical protein
MLVPCLAATTAPSWMSVWEPGARQWLVERRRIGPVIRELERTVDPLFRHAGMRLDV